MVKHLIFLSVLWTVVCGLVFGVTRYTLRQDANDPQMQIARDMSLAIKNGATPESYLTAQYVDMQNSLSPFYIIFNEEHTVLASNGKLHNQPLSVLSGVLEYVAKNATSREGGAEHYVTLQPEKGVRLAAVLKVTPLNAPGTQYRVVLVARNLVEVEKRISTITYFCAGAWAAGFASTLLYGFTLRKREA